MDVFTLSNRGYTIFKRIIETKLDECVRTAKKARKNSDAPLYYHRFNAKWVLEIDYTLGFHEHDCNDGDSMPYGEECDCDYDKMEIDIKINNIENPNQRLILMEQTSIYADEITKEKVIEWLDWVEKNKNAWKLCSCGEVATMNTACDRCYIHGYVRTEEEGGDCCVCRENDGRWLKQVCGHILHYYCYMKIPMEKERGNPVGRKCPLCRNVSAFNTTIDDCYDV